MPQDATVRLRWTAGARAELLALVRFVAAERPEAARRLAGRIQAAMHTTVDQPYIGRTVPELDVANIRERIVPPCRVICQVRRLELVVLAVVHERRELRMDVGDESE